MVLVATIGFGFGSIASFGGIIGETTLYLGYDQKLAGILAALMIFGSVSGAIIIGPIL